jgi:oligopeptidase B
LRIDEYFWLRRRGDPAVRAHLEAENAYANAWFRPLKGLQRQLYREMLSRLQEDDETVPVREGGWWYFTRTLKGRAYPVLLRRAAATAGPRGLRGPEQVLLDLNALARGKSFLQLGAFEVSPDGRWLAYSLDETGSLDYTLHVRDLTTGQDLPVHRKRTDEVAWAQDSRTLLYTTKDRALRTQRVWRHSLGQPARQRDATVWEEPDETFWVGLGTTLDRRWIVVHSASKDTTDLWVIDAQQPHTAPRRVLPRKRGREVSALEHRDGLYYLLVNDTGPHFRMVTVPANTPARSALPQAQELVPHRPEVMLEDLDVFTHHLVLTERDGGQLRLRVMDLRDGTSRHVDFGEAVGTAEGGENAEFHARHYRCTYTSLVTPDTVYDLDLRTHTLRQRKRRPVGGGYRPQRYDSARLETVAPDGTRVPVSLVWRRDRRRPGTPQPLLLEGYGAYGVPSDAYFSSARLSLLDRGVVVAIAHVRGGGDLGRTWYDAGKLARKPNTFSDFVACAQALVDQGWTTPAQLIIEGGSAGGLLVGAAANLRPDLFAGVVAEVPFVDVLNTMLDATLPLTVGEYLEWGNPNRPADYRRMRAWSPYDNLRPADYPAFFLRAALNDSQVPYWEAAKFAARLRDVSTGQRPVVLSVNLAAGHGGASGRYDALRERAQAMAFMLRVWGLDGRA